MTPATPTAPPPAAADQEAGNDASDRQAAVAEAQKDEAERLTRSLGSIGSEGAAGSAARPEATAMKAAQQQTHGLFAPPYTVRLVADRRMLVQSGPYACTAAVDDVDGRRIAAALRESERVSPPAADAVAPRADATVVVPATPEAREVILRLVRERYRRALEDRCGPLPN